MVKLSLASSSYSPILLPGALSKVLSRQNTWSISSAGAIAGEIEDVDADIAQHAVGAVLRATAARATGRIRAPVAPGLGNQPALQIARLDVPDLADGAGQHELARLLQLRRRCGRSG